MKIDGYIIHNNRGSGNITTYMPAAIEKVGRSTFTVIAANGEKRTFNLEKDYQASTRHVPVWKRPAIGQHMTERGSFEGYYSRPVFNMDVEVVRQQADKANAAAILRNRYRKAHKAISDVLNQYGQDGSRAPETLVVLLEQIATMIPAPTAPVNATPTPIGQSAALSPQQSIV
jgi:hypothetical protein